MSGTDTNYPKLGKNIRGLRKAFGETQLDLALSIGASGPNVISQYESGERIPERDYLFKIAKHYRITENELLLGNFENMRSLSWIPIGDKDFSKNTLSKAFPLICTPEALENAAFREAYTMHCQLIEALNGNGEFDENDIVKCAELYKTASRNGLDEATANHLWMLMFFGFLSVFITPRLAYNIEILASDKISSKDIIDGMLPVFDEVGSEIEFDTSSARTEFLKDNEVDLVVDIALLRRSNKYADLGDYYLALRHRYSLLSNTLSMEMNRSVGDELLLTFSLMGNKYCDEILSVGKPK